MARVLLAVMMVLSFHGPAEVHAAGASCPAASNPPGSEVKFQRTNEIDESLLFAPIPDGVDSDVFELDFFIEGRLVASETVELMPLEGSEGLVIELLSRSAALRSDFIKAGQRQGDATIAITASGTLIAETGLDHLLRQSRSYREDLEAPLPARTVSEARVLAPSLLFSPSSSRAMIPTKLTPCEEQCAILFPCEPTPIGGFNCDPGLVPCLEQCDDCVVSSETVVETVLFSITALGPSECFWDFGFARVYDWSRIRYKTTRKRIDYNADCTTTVTILEVTYQDIFCFYPGVITGCFNPTTRYSTCF